MKRYILPVFLVFQVLLVPFIEARDFTPKWRDAMQIKDLAKAREKAEKEKKLITVIVSYEKYDSEMQGAAQAVEVIDDTIKALKSSSIIVRSSVGGARDLKVGDEFNIALAEGLRKGGNGLPMIIVINPVSKKLVEVIDPGDILKEGSKAFRDVKKAARELKKK